MKIPAQNGGGDEPRVKIPEPPKPIPPSLNKAMPASVAVLEHLAALEKALKPMARELERAQQGGAIPLARAFVVLHHIHQKFDFVAALHQALFDRYKTETFPQVLEQSGITNVPLEEGFRVTASSRIWASIVKGMKVPAFAWLRDPPDKYKPLQLQNLITETVNASSLSSAAKDMVEGHNLELPDKLFNVAYVPNTSVTRTK